MTTPNGTLAQGAADSRPDLTWLPEWLRTWADEHPFAAEAVSVGALLVLCAVVLAAIQLLVLPLLRRAIKRSTFEWDDAFIDHKFFRWLSLIPPAMIAHYGAAAVARHAAVQVVIEHVAATALVIAAMLSAGALLNSVNAIYSKRPQARNRPIKGYLQIVKIFIYVIGSILAVCALLGENPALLLGGIGALSAVLMLIFKDTILSLVASIQLTSNDMLRVGDWIEMPKFAADGDVIDIALHTIKVQNWDKTVTTIPTYALISESYKNWRGMQESGGRRIKRNIYIDVSTVRFLDDDEIERFSRFAVLADYMRRKKTELDEDRRARPDDAGVSVNRRQLTNLGTLRAYIAGYFHQHPQVHDRMTFLVRQLQPTEHGLPIEIYIFTKTVVWAEYEAIQADIFDHILAIIPEFGLAVYQQPAGHDLAQAAASLRPSVAETAG